MDISRSSQDCAVDRAVALAGLAPVQVRSGHGWLAARSGARSNDLNVVVGEPGLTPHARVVDELTAWFGPVPASWLVARRDDALTDVLRRAGWRPERTGRCCGRELVEDVPPPDTAAVEVETVASEVDVEAWLDVADACGWYDDQDDRAVRGELLRACTGDLRRAAWVARLGGRPVGMASGWCDASRVEVVDLAVHEEHRRHGVGTALVAGVLAWGAGRGAREVVAQPSPDGWRLFEALGFTNVPVEPDVCFYSP